MITEADVEGDGETRGFVPGGFVPGGFMLHYYQNTVVSEPSEKTFDVTDKN